MQIFSNPNPVCKCPICGKTFKIGNLNCLVNHLPGTCCHYGDREIIKPEDKEDNNDKLTH